jgi:hypothetical protein
MVVKRKRLIRLNYLPKMQNLATNRKPLVLPSEGKGQGFESLRARQRYQHDNRLSAELAASTVR